MSIRAHLVPNSGLRDEIGQPNELDLRRIRRALLARSRYRYVSPDVLPVLLGYRIVSPCCSRRIDAGGEVIDIALLRFWPGQRRWSLHYKDHGADEWLHYADYGRLHELLEQLNEDENRVFWQ